MRVFYPTWLYSTVIKKSSPYAPSVVISQSELLICSHFQFWLAHQVKSQAQKQNFCFSPVLGRFFDFFLKIFNSSDSVDCLEFNDIFFLNTCKSTKFYLPSMIFRKRLIIFEIKIHPWFSRFVGVEHKTCQKTVNWTFKNWTNGKKSYFAQKQLFVTFTIFVPEKFNTNKN